MGVLETTLIGGAAAVGGWFAWKKMHDWNPEAAGAGDAIARTGTTVSNQLGRATELTGVVAGGAIRTGGELVAKGAGLTVSTAGAVVTKVVPGRDGGRSGAATPPTAAPSTPTAKKTAGKEDRQPRSRQRRRRQRRRRQQRRRQPRRRQPEDGSRTDHRLTAGRFDKSSSGGHRDVPRGSCESHRFQDAHRQPGGTSHGSVPRPHCRSDDPSPRRAPPRPSSPDPHSNLKSTRRRTTSTAERTTSTTCTWSFELLDRDRRGHFDTDDHREFAPRRRPPPRTPRVSDADRVTLAQAPSIHGSCQLLWPRTSASASGGPQDPGAYGCTGGGASTSGCMMRHASSTPS